MSTLDKRRQICYTTYMKEELNSNLDNFLRRLGQDNLHSMKNTVENMLSKPALRSKDVLDLGNTLDLLAAIREYMNVEMD